MWRLPAARIRRKIEGRPSEVGAGRETTVVIHHAVDGRADTHDLRAPDKNIDTGCTDGLRSESRSCRRRVNVDVDGVVDLAAETDGGEPGTVGGDLDTDGDDLVPVRGDHGRRTASAAVTHCFGFRDQTERAELVDHAENGASVEAGGVGEVGAALWSELVDEPEYRAQVGATQVGGRWCGHEGVGAVRRFAAVGLLLIQTYYDKL